ncbi:hypothetical protein LAZ67_13000438 [Cordylochernes scorpioides]|uniref:Uncharacterized protein n=1 Tax=Cordylochernes scorpioides TaxID=51811 RepID=A0ABY6L7U5_9ARAC|nr:hypothetical protein LAZ67_13000438 [Cordylochernes scorpioides]
MIQAESKATLKNLSKSDFISCFDNWKKRWNSQFLRDILCCDILLNAVLQHGVHMLEPGLQGEDLFLCLVGLGDVGLQYLLSLLALSHITLFTLC